MPVEVAARIRSSGMGSMVCFIGLVILLSSLAPLVKAAAAPKRILVLYWYNKDFSSNVIFDRSFQASLKSAPAGRIEYYTEYVESDRFPGENQYEALRDYLSQKYANRHIDVVVAVSDVPLEFLLKYRDNLFTQTPIVFAAIKRPATNESSGPGLTGIVLGGGYKRTLDLALRLHPGTKQVFIISGTLNHDKKYETLCREELKGLDSGISINYFTDFSLEELIFKTKRLPERSVVLYIWQQSQNEQGQLLETQDILNAIAPSTTAPIYGVSAWQVGTGVVGGYLRSFEHDATRMGEIALRIANGARAQDIPMESAETEPMFDWGELKRWGLRERALPPGSIVLNKPLSVWEVYKRYIIAGIFLLLLQAVIIAGLLWQRAKRRKSEQDLIWRLQFESLVSHFSSTFINLREEEVNVNIRQNMAHLGNFLDLDRISLFEFSPDGQQMEAIFSWNRTGVGAPPRIVGTGDLLWWRSKLLRGEVSLATDLNDMPEEALAEKEYFRQLGILSAASIPLKMAGEVNGAISFVSTRRRISWKPDVVSQLQVVGEILWSALQRKRAVAILRESEERFRLVANTAPVLIWMSGPDKLCNYTNQSWLDFTGRTLEAELGNGWLEGVHPEDLKNCLDVYTRAFDLRESFKMQYRMRRHDGEYRWLLDIGVPRLNPDGLFVGYIGSCLDVTDGKLAEEALSGVGRRLIEAHEEERTWLARELHDDINQRIALLVIQLERWAQHPPSSGVDVTDHIRPVLEQLSDLGKDIQALSHRLHSSKLEYLGIAVAANGFCKELSEQQKVEIDFSHAEVPRGLPKEISLCLFRVLQEALQNAVKHSGERHFSVELHGTSQEIQLTVSDSGVGFDQQDAITRRGLGLISMRERMQLVGGEFSIKSKRGAGTTIRARVPFIAEEHRATATG
jgi:PAS domain S-box-containing protein